MDPIEKLVQDLLNDVDHDLVKLSQDVQYRIGHSKADQIGYAISDPDQREEILRWFPIKDWDSDDLSPPATHPVINRLLSYPLNNQDPFVLYLYTGKDPRGQSIYQRFEYNNIKSIFDVLGAIESTYNQLTDFDPFEILGDHLFFEGLVPYEDGYKIALGS